ncbi:MAG: translocation/assembly module TamB domain-containing protein, partial [Verrucomicrobiota bacterium]
LSGDLSARAQVAPEVWRIERGELSLDGLQYTVETAQAEVAIAALSLDLEGGGLDWRYALSGNGELTTPERTEPWRLASEGAIDPERLRLTTLEAELEAANLTLEAPLEVQLDPLDIAEAAQLSGQVDLAALGLSESGLVAFSGTAQPEPAARASRFNFDLTVSDLPQLPEVSGSIEGRIDPREVLLVRLAARLGERELLEGSGGYSFEDQALKPTEVTGNIAPELASTFIEAWPTSDPLRFSLRASGAPSALEYEGEITTGEIALPVVKPFALTAKFGGQGISQLALEAQAEMADAQIGLALNGGLREGVVAAELTELRIEQAAGTLLALTQAAEIEVAFGESPLRFDFGGLALAMPASQGRLSLSGSGAMGEQMDVSIDAESLQPTDFNALLQEPLLPEAAVRRLAGELSVANPEAPLTGQLQAEIAAMAPSEVPLVMRGELTLGANALTIKALEIRTRNIPLIRADGTAPLRVQPFANQVLAMSQQSWDIGFEIDMAELPEPLRGLTEARLQNLQAEGRLTGAAMQPSGETRLSLAQFTYPAPDGGEDFHFEGVEARLTLDEEAFALENLTFRQPSLAESPRIQARVADIPWERLAEQDWEALSGLSGSLQIRAFPLEAVAIVAPTVVEREGSIEADLDIAPGFDITGNAAIKELALKPMPTGTLREVSIHLGFSGKRVELESLEGSLGGRELRATGYADYGNWPQLPFRVEMEGDQLDVLRDDGLIIRSNLRVLAEGSGALDAVALSGDVELVESLFVQNLRDFTQGGTAGVASQPPFFSVEQAPFSEWTLDLSIRGDRFLRVRSPVLNTAISADFDLTGTLGSPLLVGEGGADSGALSFPFGRLTLRQAEARITQARPNEVQLNAAANGNTLGYSVTLNLDGTMTDPQVTLQSIPPADSEELLLMLTTGAMPGGDAEGELAARAGRLALFIGQDVFSPMFGGGGSGEPRIEVHSEGSLSQSGRSTQGLEYIVNDDWSVIGEYDEFSNYNLDLKWRFYKKKGGSDAAAEDDTE